MTNEKQSKRTHSEAEEQALYAEALASVMAKDPQLFEYIDKAKDAQEITTLKGLEKQRDELLREEREKLEIKRFGTPSEKTLENTKEAIEQAKTEASKLSRYSPELSVLKERITMLENMQAVLEQQLKPVDFQALERRQKELEQLVKARSQEREELLQSSKMQGLELSITRARSDLGQLEKQIGKDSQIYNEALKEVKRQELEKKKLTGKLDVALEMLQRESKILGIKLGNRDTASKRPIEEETYVSRADIRYSEQGDSIPKNPKKPSQSEEERYKIEILCENIAPPPLGNYGVVIKQFPQRRPPMPIPSEKEQDIIAAGGNISFPTRAKAGPDGKESLYGVRPTRPGTKEGKDGLVPDKRLSSELSSSLDAEAHLIAESQKKRPNKKHKKASFDLYRRPPSVAL